jgi:hypothetical protein
MNTRLISLMLALMFTCVLAAAQHSDRQVVDEAGMYKITLTGDWRPVTYIDAVGRTKTEYVLCERGEGLLKINKESLDRRSTADIVRQELESLKLCQPGVIVGGDEVFAGAMLTGRRLAFCYIEGSRLVTATYYFLEERDSVWILRFTGRMGLLDAKRDETDRIARSFCPMKRLPLPARVIRGRFGNEIL